MSPTPDEITLAVLGARMDDLIARVSELAKGVHESARLSVPMGMWEQRNKHVDDRFQGHGREIGDNRQLIMTEVGRVRADMNAELVKINDIFKKIDERENAKRTPWTSTGAFLVSALTAVIVLINEVGGV